MPEVSIVTFNVRGLRNAVKRRSIFRFLHQWYPKHVIVLQETHSDAGTCAAWRAEWGAPIFFSHGTSTSECGVAVLLPRALLSICDVNSISEDEGGRFLMLEFRYRSVALILCAVYAPTQSHSQHQVEFFRNLKLELDLVVNGEINVILCGDLNVHLSALDTQNQFRLSTAAKILLEIAHQLNLVDVWREKYKERRQYTWRRFSPFQQSRIDYIMVNEGLLQSNILKCIEIRPSICSDHSLVNLELIVHTCDKGRGLFRFDNTLLDDDDFVAFSRLEITKANNKEGVYEGVDDVGLRIEILTSEIRVKSIKLVSWKTRQRKESEKVILEKVKDLELKLGSEYSDELESEYIELKDRIELMQQEKGRQAMLRSGARWLELGEKPTRYFFKLSASRQKEKDIHVLQKPDGEFVTGNKDILRYCHDHYKEMYRSQAPGQQREYTTASFLQPSTLPRLTDAEKAKCEGRISYQECEQALKEMMNNKAPSTSGLTKEFFLFFWNDIGSMVVEYINMARDKGMFFVTQRRGVLTILPKKGDPKLLANKRAICLLDIVYKIVAKVISNRLMSVIHVLVSSDQTGSIKGRYIGTNIRTVADVIYYCGSAEIEGIVMALDFKNAFNTVEHEFVYDVLKLCNFGPNFIDWVKLLHSNTELSIINNGHTSEWFKPERGLQQGCPASAALFALVVETLAVRIRNAADVSGITISDTSFKISQYCDDTTIFVKDLISAEKVIEIVHEFGNISGLQLNINKCEFMWLGRKKECDELICNRVPVKAIKILGTWFSSSKDCSQLNIEGVVNRMKTTIELWSQRDLTIKGKITVVKTLIASQLNYLMAVDRVEEKSLAQIQKLIMKFVWNKRPPKVAKRTMIMSIDKGGLKLPDMVSILRASRITWIGRLIRFQRSSFAEVIHKRLRVDLNSLCKMKLDMQWVRNRDMPEFYKEMLAWFMELNVIHEPASAQTIRQQPLWHNGWITVQGKSLSWLIDSEVKVPIIDDIVDNQGHILSHQDFVSQHGIRVNVLTYMGWCRAIPVRWRRMLEGSAQLVPEERTSETSLIVDGKIINMQTVKPSFFYDLLIPSVTPTAQARWEADGVNFGNVWKKVYRRSFQVTTSTKLQSFQFKIIHRYFPTRRFLCIRNVVEDPFCDNCGDVETIEHYFYACEHVKRFWQLLGHGLNNKLQREDRIVLDCTTVLFGHEQTRHVVNLIILLGKHFIAQQHYEGVEVTFTRFLAKLFRYFDMEKENARTERKKQKFTDKWSPFITVNARGAFCNLGNETGASGRVEDEDISYRNGDTGQI